MLIIFMGRCACRDSFSQAISLQKYSTPIHKNDAMNPEYIKIVDRERERDDVHQVNIKLDRVIASVLTCFRVFSLSFLA